MATDRSGRHRRTAAWATGLSLLLHVLFLSSMVIGLKVLKPPPEERAVELQLIRPLERQAPPEPVRETPPKPITAPSVRARLTPQPSPEGPALAGPSEPAPPPAPPAPKPQVAGPPDTGIKPSVSGRMGCDDPLGIKLNEAQRQSCANNLAALGRAAKPLDNIPADKKADYDRVARRQEACRQREVPSMNPGDNPKATRNPSPSNINPYYGAGVGMSSTGGFCP